MKCEWSHTKIKDILSFVVDNRGKTPPTQEFGYPLLEVNAVSATDKFPQYQVVRKYVSQETYDTKFRKGHPKVGDILVPTVGTLGAVSYVDKKNCCIAQNIVALRVNGLVCDSNFLYYILRNPTTRKRLLNLDIGGVQPSIKVPHLLELDILLPPLLEQKKIAAILSSLDDKIKLNNKINETLEQQASILVARYMMSTFNTVLLSDIMGFDNGYAFQSSTYLPSGQYRIITIKNVQDGFIDSSDTAFINALPSKMKSCCVLHIGDVLLSLTGNVGRVGIVFENNLLLNQRVAKFVPIEGTSLPFLYFLFRQPNITAKLKSIAKGTAQLNLSPVETLKQRVPYEKKTAEICSQILMPLYQAIISNNQQNMALTKLRNSLLPKLMSGEIDVSDIQL